jgi:hypothetical protein
MQVASAVTCVGLPVHGAANCALAVAEGAVELGFELCSCLQWIRQGRLSGLVCATDEAMSCEASMANYG